jgi:uncharacterized iron-regulated protein
MTNIKKIFLIALATCSSLLSFGQNKPAYVIYSSEGKKVTYQKMINTLIRKDVVLFGEIHNNPIAHWLQYEVTTDFKAQKPLILGAEMLEADQQTALNNYLKGDIDAKKLASSIKLWPNYDTDYAPLVDFAKTNNLPFVATNVPRRFASLVFKNDFKSLDSLSKVEKSWIAPLPIPFDPELATYKNILKMMGEHGSELLVKAQAIKDATMAHFILKTYQKNHLFIHFNGAYHSDNFEGILWYLKKQNSNLKYGTISTVSQNDINKLDTEHLNKADFIICVDENMTTTY